MEEKVRAIVAKVLAKDAAALENEMDTPALWDSLHLIEIILAVEEEFDITLEPEKIAKVKTLRDLCALVAEEG